MKEYKAADKVVQKMTRTGAEVQNLATGEAENVSSRSANNDVSEQPVNTAGKVLDRADAAHSRHASKKAVKKANQTVSDGIDTINRPSSRLQFSEDERAAPELQEFIHKSDKAADRLDTARENIPKKKKLVRERTFDEALGKGKSRLRFEETEKLVNGKMKPNPLSRPVQEVGTQLHGKIREVEKENVGVEGGHRMEQFGEKAAGKGYRFTKDSIRRHKLKPYRAVAKAERASLKADTNYLYRKALHDNPQLASNPMSRFLQKQQIKRNYAKQIKDTGSAVKNTSGAVKSAAAKAKAAAEKTAAFVRRHWKGLAAVLAMGLVLMVLVGGLQSCSSIFVGSISPVVTSSYLSEESELTGVEAAYSAMEANLQYEMDNYAALHPGYDEYRYQLDGIFHDPHELAAYLSAKYVTYTASQVQSELRRLFALQYQVTVRETVETRYRTETEYDPVTGESHSVRVAYEYRILTVILKNNGFASVAQNELTPEELKMYQVYRETLGNMPLVFGGGSTDTNPSTDLSGVRFVNGTRPGNQAIVDIAKSQVGNVGGQPYWSWYGFGGRVEWCACFVSWCLNEVGHSEPRFAACTSQGVPWFKEHGQWASGNYTDIAPGDIIFFDWDNSGDADHVGIVIGKDSDAVYTVEGNSGDACKIRSYPLTSSYIHGYGLMNW